VVVNRGEFVVFCVADVVFLMPLFGRRKIRHGFKIIFGLNLVCSVFLLRRSMSCRTGPLRVGRPLRGLYTLFCS
jgi:hypothetical protein